MPNHRWQMPSSPGLSPGQLLAQHGPLIEVVVSVPTAVEDALKRAGKIVPQPVTGMGLIDTGCTRTSISLSVLSQQLQLVPMGQEKTWGVTGLCEQDVFMCHLDVSPVAIADLRTTSSNLPPGLVALLGRDLLAGCSMVYDGRNGHFTLHW